MLPIEGIKRQLDTAADLQDIVKTMKALAAVSIRQFETAVESLFDYNRTIELGLRAVLRHGVPLLPARRRTADGRLGAIVFGSDQGLCGRFNEQIVSAALEVMPELEPRRERRCILAVGARVAAPLAEANEPIDATCTVPASLAGITPTVQNLLLQLETWRDQRQVERIILLHHRLLSGAAYSPHVVHLLPFDMSRAQMSGAWPTRALPSFTMPPEKLLSSLLRQRVFVSLYRAFAESLACENASRLASMQAAEQSIADHIEELRAHYRYQRQHAITAELLDIVGGYEALQTESSGTTHGTPESGAPYDIERLA